MGEYAWLGYAIWVGVLVFLKFDLGTPFSVYSWIAVAVLFGLTGEQMLEPYMEFTSNQLILAFLASWSYLSNYMLVAAAAFLYGVSQYYPYEQVPFYFTG